MSNHRHGTKNTTGKPPMILMTDTDNDPAGPDFDLDALKKAEDKINHIAKGLDEPRVQTMRRL
jgi:hypothetical protein